MSDYCVHKLFVRGADEDLYSFKMRRFNSLAVLLDAYAFEEKEDHVVIEFNTESYPPSETDQTSPTSSILRQVAREFPNLTFLDEILYEGYYEGGQVRYCGQEVVVTDYFTSWFRTARPGEPVHHRTAIFDPEDNSVLALIAEQILFRPETAVGKNTFAFRVPVEDLPVSPENLLEYTFDEVDYFHTGVMGIANALWGGGSSGISLTLCDCPIALTQEELEWLVTARLDDVTQEKVRRIARFLYHEFSNSHPTNRTELTLLLNMPSLTDERRAEIIDAMESPRWTTRWPDWDNLTDDRTFLEELENMVK